MEKKELLKELAECYDYFFKETQSLYQRYNTICVEDAKAVKKFNDRTPLIIFIPLWVLIAGLFLIPIDILHGLIGDDLSFIAGLASMFYFAPKLAVRIIKRPKKFAEAQNKRAMEIDNIIDQIAQKYNNYANTMGKECILSIEYVEPAKIQKIYTLINSGRADTIKEAINIYENDNKMDSMKNMYQSQINNINSNLSNLEKENKRINNLANFAFWSSKK